MELLASYWLVWLHVLSAMSFLALHGVSFGIAFKLRRERDRARIMTLLDLSSTYRGALYSLLLLVVGTGVLLGFTRGWWGKSWWIWVSLGVFATMFTLMIALAKSFFQRLRLGLGLIAPKGKDDRAKAAPLSDQELERLLLAWNPWPLVAIGLGGVAMLTWLMMFKPF